MLQVLLIVVVHTQATGNSPGGTLQSTAGFRKRREGVARAEFPDRNFLASIPSLRPTPLEPGFTPNPVSHVSEP